MEIASLMVRLGITGVSQVESGLKKTDSAVKSLAGNVTDMGGAFGSAQLPMMAFAGAAGAAVSQIGGLGRMVANFAGIPIAAQMQKLEVGFTNLTGSAGRAAVLLEDLRKMGANTEFNTAELAGFSQMLLSTGSKAHTVTRELAAMADAVSFAGGSTATVGSLALNMSQIRQSLTPQMEDLKQFGTNHISLGKIVGAATGKGEMGTGEAMRVLQRMGGEQAFNTIITGMEKAFGGAAVKNAGTLLGIVQNLGETMQNIMLPTGRLLVPVLTTIGDGMKTAGEWVGKLNEATGGTGGLTFMVIGLVSAKRLLIGSFIGAVTATRALTSALTDYGIAAGNARIASGSGALNPFAGAAPAGAAVPVNGMRAAIGRAGGFLPWLKGLPAAASGAISNAGGIVGVLKGLGGGALRLGGGLLRGGGLGLIGSLGLGYLGDKVGGRWGDAFKGAGAGMGIGSLGFMFGPQVGIVTTLIGGLIGGIKGYFDSKNPQKKEEAQLDELKKQTSALEDIRSQLIGGGERARRAVGDTEREILLSRMIASGIG